MQDLESKLSVPLDYPSPIGQEELVRNMANSVLSFVQQGGDATSTAALIGFLNSYYDPILNSGKGMSFGQDLYLEGAINEVAFATTGDPTYLAAAQKWYQEGVALGPNRPQALYGLPRGRRCHRHHRGRHDDPPRLAERHAHRAGDGAVPGGGLQYGDIHEEVGEGAVML